MTTAYSFCGNCTHVCENQSDIVIVDKSYNYGLQDTCSGGNPHTPTAIRGYPPNTPTANKKIIKYDTGIVFDERNEVENRRIRIIKLMLYIIDYLVDDDAIFIDADVGIPNVKVYADKKTNKSFCIPAVNKDSPFQEIIRFCHSTNLYIKDVELLRQYLYKYINMKAYTSIPVDIYINLVLNTVGVSVPGTWHYIDGKKYSLDNVLGIGIVRVG